MRMLLTLALAATLAGCPLEREQTDQEDQERVTNEARGIWQDVTGAGLVALVLPNEEFWFFRENATGEFDGVLHGFATGTHGVFGSTATHLYDASRRVRATILGTYQVQTQLGGTIEVDATGTNFSMAYLADYRQPAQLAALATAAEFGWGGRALVRGEGFQNMFLQAGLNGVLDGIIGKVDKGCGVGGTATPRENINVFDLSVTIHPRGGASCPQAGETLSGVAFVVEEGGADDGLYAALHAPNGQLVYAFRAPGRVPF